MQDPETNDKVTSSKNKSLNFNKFLLPIGCSVFVGAMLFVTYSGNNQSISNQQNIDTEISVANNQSSANGYDEGASEAFNNIESSKESISRLTTLISDFKNLSSASPFIKYQNGLIGDKSLKDTVLYDPKKLESKILESPLEIALPESSSLLEGFPFTTFGDATLNVVNPLNTPLICKLIYQDEKDSSNYAIRHFYVKPKSSFALTGLLEGVYQVTAMSTEYPSFGFVTHQFNIYNRVENGNNIDLLGKEIQTSLFF